MKEFIRISTPLLTFIAAFVIKICFIDNLGDDPSNYIFETYIRHLWLEIFMIALGFSFIEKKQSSEIPIVKALTPAFAISALICPFLVFGLPKLKISSIFLSIWLPLLICSVLFVVVSSKLSK